MAFEVEEIYLNPYHPSPGSVTLAYTPKNPTEVAVDPVGGPAQVIDVDFLILGNTLIWRNDAIPNSDINGVLDDAEGYDVTLRVMYER